MSFLGFTCTRSSAVKQISSSALDVGKSVAKKGAKKSFRGWKECHCRCGNEVSYKSIKIQIEENSTKIHHDIGTCNARH